MKFAQRSMNYSELLCILAQLRYDVPRLDILRLRILKKPHPATLTQEHGGGVSMSSIGWEGIRKSNDSIMREPIVLSLLCLRRQTSIEVDNRPKVVQRCDCDTDCLRRISLWRVQTNCEAEKKASTFLGPPHLLVSHETSLALEIMLILFSMFWRVTFSIHSWTLDQNSCTELVAFVVSSVTSKIDTRPPLNPKANFFNDFLWSL